VAGQERAPKPEVARRPAQEGVEGARSNGLLTKAGCDEIRHLRGIAGRAWLDRR
jgi:hypothetical protein